MKPPGEPPVEHVAHRFRFFAAVRLITGTFVLLPLLLWALWAGPGVVPAVLAGGVAGLALVNLGSEQLGRFAAGAAGVPGGAQREAVARRLSGRRSLLLSALANLPFFLATFAYGLTSRRAPLELDLFGHLPPFLFAAAHTVSISSSVAYALAARSLQREG